MLTNYEKEILNTSQNRSDIPPEIMERKGQFLEELTKRGFNFFWSYSHNLKKIRDEIEVLEEKHQNREIGGELFNHLRNEIIQKTGKAKQFYNRKSCWVCAYVIDEEYGSVRWSSVNWSNPPAGLTISKNVKMNLKVWAAEKLLNDPNTLELSSEEVNIRRDLDLRGRRDKKGLSRWYRNIETTIRSLVYKHSNK